MKVLDSTGFIPTAALADYGIVPRCLPRSHRHDVTACLPKWSNLIVDSDMHTLHFFVLDVEAYAYAEGCLPVRDNRFPRRCRSAWTQHPDANRTTGTKKVFNWGVAIELGLLE